MQPEQHRPFVTSRPQRSGATTSSPAPSEPSDDGGQQRCPWLDLSPPPFVTECEQAWGPDVVAMPLEELVGVLTERGRVFGPLLPLAPRDVLEVIAIAARLECGIDYAYDPSEQKGWVVLRNAAQLKPLVGASATAINAAYGKWDLDRERAANNAAKRLQHGWRVRSLSRTPAFIRDDRQDSQPRELEHTREPSSATQDAPLLDAAAADDDSLLELLSVVEVTPRHREFDEDSLLDLTPAPSAPAPAAADLSAPKIPLLALPRRPALPPSEAEAVRGLSDEELRSKQRLFEKFDVDRDGVISWNDFHTSMRELEPDTERRGGPEVLRAMFDAADSDRDGVVNFADFIRMQLRKDKGQRESVTVAKAPPARPSSASAPQPHTVPPVAGAGARRLGAPTKRSPPSASLAPQLRSGLRPVEGVSFATAVVNTYERAQPHGDYRLGEEGWVALMQAVGAQHGLSLNREQLMMIFEAARNDGSPTIDIREVMAMPSVATYFADQLTRTRMERAEAVRQAQAQAQVQALMMAQAQAQAQAQAAAMAAQMQGKDSVQTKTPTRAPERQQRPLRAVETTRSGPPRNRFASFTPELMSSVAPKKMNESPGTGAMAVMPTSVMKAAAAALMVPMNNLVEK